MPYKQIKITVKYTGGKSLKTPPHIIDSSTAALTARAISDRDTMLWKESALILCLNSNNTLLGWNCVAIGGLTDIYIDTRIIATIALKTIAAGIILTHNHPSGFLLPSRQDILVTRRLKAVLDIIGIKFIDHIIISETDHFSLKEGCLF